MILSLVNIGVGLGRVVRERCASTPKIAGSNPSSGCELTFRSDLLLTARGGSTRALIECACMLCYPGNTLCFQRLGPPGRTRNPEFIFLLCIYLYKSPNLFIFIVSMIKEATDRRDSVASQIKEMLPADCD
jgi:hypothetical protein